MDGHTVNRLKILQLENRALQAENTNVRHQIGEAQSQAQGLAVQLQQDRARMALLLLVAGGDVAIPRAMVNDVVQHLHEFHIAWRVDAEAEQLVATVTRKGDGTPADAAEDPQDEHDGVRRILPAA